MGRKTAIKLLLDYGSIQGIYDHLDEVKPPSVKKSLTENRDVAFEAQFLTTIKLDADIALDLDQCMFGDYTRSEVIDQLNTLEFRSMIDRIPSPGGADSAQAAFDLDDDTPPTNYITVDTDDKLDTLIQAIDTPDGFSFDTETTSKDPMLARLVGLSFSTEPYSWMVCPCRTRRRKAACDGLRVLDRLGPIFTNPNVPKTAHNANYDMMTLQNHGIKVEGLAFDTMLAAHVTGEPQVGLKDLTLKFFGHTMTPITDLIGRGQQAGHHGRGRDIAKAADYAAADADFTERLRREFEPVVEQYELGNTLRQYEMPLVPVLIRMQRDGVAIDTDTLKRMSDELSENLDTIRNDMYQNGRTRVQPEFLAAARRRSLQRTAAAHARYQAYQVRLLYKRRDP